jgi:hypothetical protein
MESNDKCDLCALKVIFDQNNLSKARKIEDFFRTKNELQEKGIIDKGFNRRIFANGSGDKSEMCAVNSPFFFQNNRDKKCPEFILNMDLSVSEALSLNLSKKTVKLTSKINRLTIVILICTVIATLIAILAFLFKSGQ